MRVIIVGGGTAGWITAGYLHAYHNRLAPTVEIILIESPTAGRIGVGEATFPTLRRTLSTFGIDESEFLRRTGATFKHGVRFDDWLAPGHHYYHPFEALETGPTDHDADDWMMRRARGEARPYAYDYGVQATLADARRSPRIAADPDYKGLINYAYHVDADLLGDYLAEWFTARGVRHLRRNVAGAERAGQSGDITALRLDDGELIEADFFVDCTGFASVLTQKSLDVPFVDYGRELLTDRAVALRRPYPDADAVIDPFTHARALTSGWMWKVGLQQRSGQGYVYASAFIDDQSAEREFRETIGAHDNEECRTLRFKVGRTARSWSHNCAAIGLSGGFIEPLESTGIFLIEEAASQLARLLPVQGEDAGARDSFNRHMAATYEEIRDFIVLHYCLTRRRDSDFWRQVVDPQIWPERVRHLVDLWSRRSPDNADLGVRNLFPAASYRYVIFGMDWIGEPARARALGLGQSPAPPSPRFDARRGELLNMLPSHNDYLAGIVAD